MRMEKSYSVKVFRLEIIVLREKGIFPLEYFVNLFLLKFGKFSGVLCILWSFFLRLEFALRVSENYVTLGL